MTENRKLKEEELIDVNGGKKISFSELSKYVQQNLTMCCKYVSKTISCNVRLFKLDENGNPIVLSLNKADRDTILKYWNDFMVLGINDVGQSVQATIKYDGKQVWFKV